MRFDERQYERIARWLDGERIELTDAERKVAEEIRRDEALLRTDEVEVPAAVLERARRRARAELARPTRRGAWRYWAAGLAAAVAIACGAWLFQGALQTPPVPGPGGPVAEVPLEQAVEAMEHSVLLADLEQLADEIADFRADLLVSTQSNPTDLKLDAIEKELNTLWIEDVDADFVTGAG